MFQKVVGVVTGVSAGVSEHTLAVDGAEDHVGGAGDGVVVGETVPHADVVLAAVQWVLDFVAGLAHGAVRLAGVNSTAP